MKLSKAKRGQTTAKLKSNTLLGGFFRQTINVGNSMCFKIWMSKGGGGKILKGPLLRETLPRKEHLSIIQYWSTLGRYKERMTTVQITGKLTRSSV